MHRHLTPGVVNAHGRIRHGHQHAVADQPPRYRVRIAINLNRAIRADTPDQLARGAELRHTADRLRALVSARTKRLIGVSPVVP